MTEQTDNQGRTMPQKPYPDFPLGPHASGKWVKKIKGRYYYFGRWEDPDGALREYNAVRDALHAGRQPVQASPSLMNVRDLMNLFLNRQLGRVDSGRLEARSYADAHRAIKEFAAVVGPGRLVSDLRPTDFEQARAKFARHLGPHALNRAIANVRTAFNYGVKNGHCVGPILYGDHFDKESVRVQRRVARQNRYARGEKLFSPKDCREIVKHAPAPLKAMVLLGLNSGFYAIDIASLPLAALNLDGGWLEFPRTKTEVLRAAPLWPETVKALREAIAIRPKAKNPADEGLVFLTQWGNRWVHVKVHRDEKGITKASRSDAINHDFTDLLEALEIRRPHVNFSALRHTFRTAADEVHDDNAINLMMGHAFPGMAEFYVQAVAKQRMKAVAEHVRKVLLNPKQIRSRSSPAKKA